MGIRILMFTLALSFATGLFAAPKKPWLVVNEDNDHYYKLPSSMMNVADLEAYVDSFAKGHVTHIFWCACGEPASFASDVWERIWEGRRAKNPDIWARNCKLLHDKGIDPYAVWCRRCREKGISPWMSMRMNDSHFMQDFNYFRHTEFWRNHPELRRVPSTNTSDYAWNGKYGGPVAGAYDYVHEAVRDYHFAMAKELIDRYDADGLELDFQRAGHVLTPGKERELAPVLTGFVRRVREYATARRGRGYGIAVRLPTLPDQALQRGFDFPAWAAADLVDVIIASPVWCTPCFDIPVEEWKTAIANPHIVFLPGTDHGVQCARGRPDMDVPFAKGWASNAYSRGADGLYLFNFIYLGDSVKDAIWSGALSPENVRHGYRRHIADFAEGTQMQFPKTLSRPAEFTVRLPNGPVSAKSAEAVLSFDSESDRMADVEVTVNGVKAARGVRKTGFTDDYFRDAHPAGHSGWRYAFDVQALKSGQNTISIKGMAGENAKAFWGEIALDAPDGGIEPYFVKGADTSWMTEMAKKGWSVKDASGTERECLDVMKRYGVEGIRLRVWVDPSAHGGWCDAKDVLAKGRHATLLGMAVMVDFHYGDWWCDPGKQPMPAAWKGLGQEELCSRVAKHTEDVLSLLRNSGVNVRWVQIGNETDNGMMWPAGDIRGENGHPDAYAAFFRAGERAARKAVPWAAIILHLADGKNWQTLERNMDIIRRGGGKWDILGLSLYPWHWRMRSTPEAREAIKATSDNIGKVFAKYGTPSMIVETGYDTSPEVVAESAKQMKFCMETMRANLHCRGVWYWEPQCRPKGHGYKLGAFDDDGKPTAIMDAFAERASDK